MKKILSILLILVMAIGLTGCGKNTNANKDLNQIRKELVKSTPKLDLTNLWEDIEKNKASAKEKYEGNNYKITVRVQNIETDYFEYKEKYNDSIKTLIVYLPTEELAKLNDFEQITIIGKLTNIKGIPKFNDTFIIDDYVEKINLTEKEIQEKITSFGGSGGDGHTTWDEGSYPFFIDNMLSFEKVNADMFYSNVKGQWQGKHYADGDKYIFSINFIDDNTAEVRKGDSEAYEWKYVFNEYKLSFPIKSSDTYEVRKVSDNLYVFYNNYNPYWIIYK